MYGVVPGFLRDLVFVNDLMNISKGSFDPPTLDTI